MFLIVGLGNPGVSYRRHRHNIGFMAVEALARYYDFSPERQRFQGFVAKGNITTSQVAVQALVLKPQTYMNESGRSVREAARFYKIPPDHILVFHDELDLPFGKLRVKQGGGAAGHNGLKSITQHIGPDFIRVRLGIGHPGTKELVTPHVLSDFSRQESLQLEPWLQACSEAVDLLVTGQDARFQSLLNQTARARL